MAVCDINCTDIQANAADIAALEASVAGLDNRIDAIEGGHVAVVVKTSTYTATSTNVLIVCNKSTAMTINLPAATGSGKYYYIKSINSGVVTVDGKDAETIDSELTQTLTQWDSMEIVDYATGVWAIV